MQQQHEVIDVCGVPFEVIEREVPAVRPNDTNYAEIAPIEGKIWLNGKASLPIKEVSLIHEWIHGVFNTNEIDHTEEIASVLSTELYRQGFRVARVKCPPKSSKGRVPSKKYSR